MRRSCGLPALAMGCRFARDLPRRRKGLSSIPAECRRAQILLRHQSLGTRTRRTVASMISKPPNDNRPSAAIASSTPPYD